MSQLNPLNDLSKVYLDQVAKINQQQESDDVKRWEEGEKELQHQMETSAKELATLGAPQMEEETNYVEAYVKELHKIGSPMKEEKKAAKDYDGDGKVESGKDEYFGSKDKAIKKAMGKKVKESWRSKSNWRNDLSDLIEVAPMTDVEMEKEVKEKKVNNKVVINPKMSEAVAQIGGEVISETEVDLQEKKKDTPLQVAAVIDKDRAKKATDDATYDRMHGKNKKADEDERYSEWERYKMKRDAQRAGHPWKHAKGSTTEKEGKKSEKSKHVYDPLHNKEDKDWGYDSKGQSKNPDDIAAREVKELQKAGKTLKDTPVVKADKTANPNYKGQKFGVKEEDDWIQKAVKRPGAFTRKAKAAGQTVQQFAKTVDDNPGKYSTRTKRQANLAQTFASMKKEDVEELFYTLIAD